MKISVYDKEGKELSQAVLPKEIFGLEVNPDLVWQVAVSQGANRRHVIADTKDRGEVRGGGRKPWKQKGTGRARHGSRRSPLWRGGGVTFGPTNSRNFKEKIGKKQRRKALFMVLSSKAKEKTFFLLEDFIIDQPKTKLVVAVLNKLSIKGSCLIVLPGRDEKLEKAAANIEKVKVAQAKDLNALDLLSFKNIILLKDSVKVIKDTFDK
jgi:large subunit ribosomal protein L4